MGREASTRVLRFLVKFLGIVGLQLRQEKGHLYVIIPCYFLLERSLYKMNTVSILAPVTMLSVPALSAGKSFSQT